MSTGLLIGTFCLSAFVFYFIITNYLKYKKKVFFRNNSERYDKIALKKAPKDAISNSEGFYCLMAWEKNHIYVLLEGNAVKRIPYSYLAENYSLSWREYQKEAFKYMKNKDWSFGHEKFSTSTPSEVNKYDTMNETYLNVALANALKNEEYEEAKKIKEALEKFR